MLRAGSGCTACLVGAAARGRCVEAAGAHRRFHWLEKDPQEREPGLLTGAQAEALALGEKALANHDKALGRDHSRTKDSARVTADAIDTLSRTEEAKALRERYGLTPGSTLLAKITHTKHTTASFTPVF
jgi:hypothetical protein